MADLTYSSLNNWLKFKHLVLLETLARTNNMHLAAEQMNLSQPAVSKMLKEIESLLGFQVFERLPRNMPVTALGEHVIRYAQRVLNDAKHFVEDIEILRLGGHGFLKVGGIFAATAVVIPNSIIEIKKQWPLLSIDVVEQTSDHLMEMLSEHTLDLAIGRFTDVTQSQFFDFQPLGPEPFCIVVNHAHPCAQKKFCTLEELLNWPWVLYPKGTPIRERMEGAFARAKVKIPLNTVNTMSMQTFLQILKGAPMVGMLPEAMVIDQVKEGQLQILETDLILDAQDYGILTRKDEPVSDIAAAFINILLKNAKRK
ncbi:LysR family transcriptional regulator [Acinetobacter lactucae]|uniref:HTH lysR-type domain-containing protein n=1 Tax=Acinetobacter lactucae TaxID=1785128 RepID=R8YUI9_9GAMM|nr:LysR family transcriptional regulator [Acinetobacter lactucae]EOQ72761.1 hypothetical protein F929_02696 [Acinetobacter lactucae]